MGLLLAAFSWTGVLWIVGILAALGGIVIALNPGAIEFLVAKACLTLAVVVFAARVGATLASSQEPFWVRGVLTALIFSVTAVSWVEGWRWLTIKQSATSSPKNVSMATTPSSRHAARLRPILQEDLGVGDKIEYDMRGDANVDRRVSAYAKRIEDWRTLIGHLLRDKLPNSGADAKFLTFRPTVGVGPTKYEYDRLNDMRANLVAVIDNLESYCSKGSSLPDGTEDLVRLRADGVALRNRHLGNEIAWMPWHHEWETWQKAVVREMRVIGVRPGDIGLFITLDQVPAQTFSWSVGPTHAKDLGEFSEQLTRLQQIIERHDSRPPTREAASRKR